MTLFALLAAGGLLTWVMRATFIVLAPPGAHSARIVPLLRRAAPAAFAAMAATTLSKTLDAVGGPVWPWLLAVAVTGGVAWRTRNLAICLATATATITVLTAL